MFYYSKLNLRKTRSIVLSDDIFFGGNCEWLCQKVVLCFAPYILLSMHNYIDLLNLFGNRRYMERPFVFPPNCHKILFLLIKPKISRDSIDNCCNNFYDFFPPFQNMVYSKLNLNKVKNVTRRALIRDYYLTQRYMTEVLKWKIFKHSIEDCIKPTLVLYLWIVVNSRVYFISL